MTDPTGVVYVENETYLSWLIGLGAVCDENQIEQWCDRSYRFGLHKKQYWTFETYRIRCSLSWKPYMTMMWLIFYVQSILKMKLSYRIWSDRVWSVKKIRQDKDVTDCVGVIYAKNETKLWWPIRSGLVCYHNKIGQRRDWLYMCDLHQKWNWAIVIDQTKWSLWWKPYRTTMWSIV